MLILVLTGFIKNAVLCLPCYAKLLLTAGIFSWKQTYSVTNGLAPAAATAKTKDDKQEDNEDNNPPDPAPAAAAKTAAGVAAAVIAAAVVVAASASIVTVVVAAAATGRYLLFSHGKNLLKNL